jgi:SAM-dependent methyltransferase
MPGIEIRRLIDEKCYPQYGDRWDDILFRQEIESLITPKYHLMDLGAGSGNNPHMNFRGKVAKVVGVDPHPSVAQNPFLDDARIERGGVIPYDDNSFDIVIAANTLEHVNHPERVFREVNRVLKPGGIFLVKTPNKYHYIPLLSRLTPFSFHRFYNKLRGLKEDDVFPTRYRANDPNTLYHLARLSGFKVISLNLFEGRPEYLRLFWPSYLCGLLFERLVNGFELLRRFRLVIIAEFRKP